MTGVQTCALPIFKLLLGSPLIAYTIELAKKNHFFDKVVVSTDSDEISEVSRTYGIDVVSRPSELSGDLSRTEGALIHVLDYYKNKGIEFDRNFKTILRNSGSIGSAALWTKIQTFAFAFVTVFKR